jgi:hypothetical protein
MSALPVGTRLLQYVIESVAGEGGFGIVYLAKDTMLDCEVAIKEYLPASLAARSGGTLQVDVRVPAKRVLFDKGMRRFLNEAHILARFRHPALVSVMNMMEANGTVYMVMPFYRGSTLREMVRGGFRASSTESLFSLLLPVLDGLKQIHSVSCYHLDISSDNILILEKNGAPVLLDFGAARHTELTGENPSTIILKQGFAPIEQYGSDNEELTIGPWTDIYAASAVAYLLVTGTMPTVSVARIIRETVRPLVEQATPALPAGVLKVIDAGLAVKPEGRPQTVEEYVAALLAGAGGGEVYVSPPPVNDGAAPRPILHGSAAAHGNAPPIMPFPQPARSDGGGQSAAVRWFFLFAALVCVMAFFLALSGCSTLFDSPPPPDGAKPDAAVQVMGRIASAGERGAQGYQKADATVRKAMNMPDEAVSKGKDILSGGGAIPAAGRIPGKPAVPAGYVPGKAAAPTPASTSTPPTSTPTQRETPALTFERSETDTPQLALRGLEDAVLAIDDEVMDPDRLAQTGRIVPVEIGQHTLRIECPFDPPFSASFSLETGERAVLRGACSPTQEASRVAAPRVAPPASLRAVPPAAPPAAGDHGPACPAGDSKC